MRTIEQLGILCLLAASFTFSGCRKCDELHKGVSRSAFYRVPGDFKTITEAIRHANEGDGIDVAAGIYSEETGEELPLRITRGIYISAQRFPNDKVVQIIVDGSKSSAAFIVESQLVSIHGFAITQKGPEPAVGIDCNENASCSIGSCLFATNVGVRVRGGDAYISNNLFRKHVADPLPATGIAVLRGSGAILRNTIMAYETNVLLQDAILRRFRENIIVRGGIGVSIDGATLDRKEELLFRNDVWGNTVANWYNADTKGPLQDSALLYGENISEDPVFVDQENDFRIHGSSPAARIPIPDPKPEGVPDTISIGAFEVAYYRTAFVLGVSPDSPQGFLPRAPEIEVLRFTATAAPTADVVLKATTFGVDFSIVSNGKTATWPTNMAIVETVSRQPIMMPTITPSPNSVGEVHFTLTHDAYIYAGTTKTYSVLVDTSTFQAGEGVRFTLTRFDWSDGVIPRIYDGKTQRIEGNDLSF